MVVRALGVHEAKIRDHWVNPVVRSIDFMTKNLDRPYSLDSISGEVFISPFHFHRIFCAVTCSTPARFLTALRIARAKQLLLETGARCTDISIAVGYSSFGTFTSQFGRLVGLTPGRFRQYGTEVADVPVHDLLGELGRISPPAANGIEIGIGARPDGLESQVAVGAFRGPGMVGRPVCVGTGWSPGTVYLGRQARTEHIEAICVHPDATAADLLCERPRARTCLGRLVPRGPGGVIEFWPHQVTDLPVLFAFPLAWAM